MKSITGPLSPSNSRQNPMHKFYQTQNKKHLKQLKQTYLDRFKTRSVYGQYERIARRNELENNANTHSQDVQVYPFNKDKRSKGIHINMKLIKSCNVNNSIIAQLNCRTDQRKLLNKDHSNAYYTSKNSPREPESAINYEKQKGKDLFCIAQTQLVGFRENALYKRHVYTKVPNKGPTVENRFNEIRSFDMDPTIEL